MFLHPTKHERTNFCNNENLIKSMLIFVKKAQTSNFLVQMIQNYNKKVFLINKYKYLFVF